MTPLRRSAFVIIYMIMIIIRIIWPDSTPYLIAALLISAIAGLILEFLPAKRVMPPEIETDAYREFKSKYGQTIIAPSKWTSENTSSAWVITSEDKYAVIEVFWGETPFDHESAVNGIIDKVSRENSGLQRTPWIDIVIDGKAARKCSIEVLENIFVFYAIPSDVDPYLIVLRGDSTVICLNRDFYEKTIMTFKGKPVV